MTPARRRNRRSRSDHRQSSVESSESLVNMATVQLRPKSMTEVSKEYLEQCTAHGISHAYVAPSKRWRNFWTVIFIVCITAMIYQITKIIIMYLKFEKSVSIELLFDKAPFPAVTICNQNPFRVQALYKVESAASALNILNAALQLTSRRSKRSIGRDFPHVPAYGQCHCPTDPKSKIPCMVGLKEQTPPHDTSWTPCICDWNKRGVGSAWPCYPDTEWVYTTCTSCSDGGTCSMPADIKSANRFRRSTEAPPTSSADHNVTTEEVDLPSVLNDGEYYCACNHDYNHCVVMPNRVIVRTNLIYVDQRRVLNSDASVSLPTIFVSPEGRPSLEAKDDDVDKRIRDIELEKLQKFDINKPLGVLDEVPEMMVDELADIINDESDEDDLDGEIGSDTFNTEYNRLAVDTDELSANESVPLMEVVKQIRKRRQMVKAMGYKGMSDPLAVQTKGRENIMFTVSALPVSQRVNLSHSFYQIIKKCAFGGKPCDFHRDFKLTIDPNFGNCYTFNWDVNATKHTTRAGPDYGLRLLAYVDRDEYMPTAESIGFQITAHNQADQPFPAVEGTGVPVGSMAMLAISRRAYYRLAAPYGKCLDLKESDSKTDENSEKRQEYIYGNTSYKLEGCFRSCAQHRFVAECGCAHPLYPTPSNSTACEVHNGKARKCLEKQMDLFAQNFETFCNCPQACIETTHTLSYSTTIWPSESGKVADCRPNDALCIARYRRNAALIQVYYRELNYELFREEPLYTLEGLLSDFGGTMGLWLGISLVSMMELTIFFINLTKAWKMERVEKERQRKASEEERERKASAAKTAVAMETSADASTIVQLLNGNGLRKDSFDSSNLSSFFEPVIISDDGEIEIVGFRRNKNRTANHSARSVSAHTGRGQSPLNRQPIDYSELASMIDQMQFADSNSDRTTYRSHEGGGGV